MFVWLVKRVEKRRTYVILSEDSTKDLVGRDRKHDAVNSPQVEETGGLCSPFTGHIVCCLYHYATTMTLHQLGADTMLAVGARASAQLGHYHRRRENARTECQFGGVPATCASGRFRGEVKRRCASRRTSRYATARRRAIVRKSGGVHFPFL